MATVQRTTTYAVCPTCGEDAGEVNHLLGQDTKTAWYCDACGKRYGLTFHASGEVDIYDVPGRKITTTDLLMLPPQTKPVYFIVEGMRFEDEPRVADNIRAGVARINGEQSEVIITKATAREEHEHKQFFYESHSCPTNWLKPEMVYFDGDSDPHGLIEYVATRDTERLPRDESVGPNDHDRALVAFIESSALRGNRPPEDRP